MIFHEISITKFHKFSIFLKILLKSTEIFEISWNILDKLDTTLKIHICQKFYENSLKINEISLKIWSNFTKVPIEISLKMSIEISEH